MKSIDSKSDGVVQASKRDWLKWAGGAALVPMLAASRPALAAPAGPRATYFPNTVVQTHDGRKLRFYDDVVRGKVVSST